MPIRPQHKWFYPIDWPQLSAMIRFERAKGRCERCGRPRGREVQHLGDGRWWDEDERTWRNGRGRALRRLARGDGIIVRTTLTVSRDHSQARQAQLGGLRFLTLVASSSEKKNFAPESS